MILDFRRLVPHRTPNRCLAVPAAWGRGDADLTAPEFALSPRQLREALEAVAAREPRTAITRVDREAGQIEFEQRTRWLGFTDRITAEIVDLGGGRSGLAIYSRSQRGYWDLGVNRRRVRRWLAAREGEVAKVGGDEPGPRGAGDE